MLTYEGTKEKGLKNIREAVDLVMYSNNHEVNKKLLVSILESTQEMLRLEDLQSCMKKGDIFGMHEVMKKEWIR